MGSNDMPELGSKISLISKADIRYEGKLFTVDPQDCTIALANVRSFGTEDRVTDHPVPAQAQVYDYILFRATDIKDISVIPSPPVLFDPAIVQLSVPPSINPTGGSRFQAGFQHPIVGAFGSGAGDAASRTVGSGAQPSYNPMQASSLLNPLQQRTRQTSESQRHNGSVAELLGSTAAAGGAAVTTGSRSSTPGLGRRISEQGTQSGGNQRQSPPRYGGADQGNQRNRNNSQSNSSNHEDRSYNSRQYSQTKPREQQPQQQLQPHQQQQQQRFGNRNMDNGFNYNNRDNRNDGGYNRDNRNDGGFNRDNRNNDGGFNRDNRNNDGGFNRDNRNDFNRNDGGFMRNNDNYGNRNNQPQNMQQRRYPQQQPGQQNQRIMHPRGGSGDRLQDQQQRGGLGGQRRNQGWTNNNQRQGGGQRQGQRQNNQRRQFAFNGQPKQTQTKQPLKFDSDYDFDKANTEFEELRLSLAQVKIAEGNNAEAPAVLNPPPANPADDKKDDSGNETAVGECDQEDEGVQQVSSAYDKTKSFFDNISCEAIERSKGRSQRTDWRKELKLNSETFGVTMSRRFYIPRGRGYYNRGSSWNYKPRQQQNNMITAKV